MEIFHTYSSMDILFIINVVSKQGFYEHLNPIFFHTGEDYSVFEVLSDHCNYRFKIRQSTWICLLILYGLTTPHTQGVSESSNTHLIQHPFLIYIMAINSLEQRCLACSSKNNALSLC